MVDARERSGAAALRRSFTLIPDFGARNGVWDDMSPASGRNGRCGATALRGRLPFTQNPDLGAGVGPGTTRRALRGGCYGRSGATALRGSCTQTPDLGARSGIWNDMRSDA